MGMKSQMGTGIVKLWAMVACVVALLAAVSGAARAGQWSQYDPTGNIPWWQNPTAAGQTVMSGYAIMDGFDFNGIWPWDVYPSGDPTLSDIYEGQPQLATAGRYTTVANGTETFTFYWTHGNGYNDTNDPAPSTASFIVTSALYLNAVADPFTFALSHFIVDDCFGADVIPILDSLPNLGVSISAVHPYLVTVPFKIIRP